MYAVIMAGGEGSRLRPLTCEIPKPLAPLCGKPVVEYILDLLKKHGCSRATLTLMYLGNELVKHFPDAEYSGIPLDFAFEDVPLGTAGSVKNAAKTQEDFLVISGDAMCDFDLTAAFTFHRERQAAATLVVTAVEDPREYGLVQAGEDGCITGFLEKPSRMNCVSGLANTGIYILSPEVLELIPDGQSSDFSFDIFPEMLKRGMKLCAYQAKGYWKDIGDIKSYLDCQHDMLGGKVCCELSGVVRDVKDILTLPQGCTVDPPVAIGKNVTLEPEVVIGRGSVIGDNVTIGQGSKIRGAVLANGVSIGERCGVNQAVLCEDATLENGCGVYEYAVIGRHAAIQGHSFVHPRVKVWDYKTVPRGTNLKENLQYGDVCEAICEEDGISGTLGGMVSPHFCATVGYALGSLKKDAIIGVGSDGSAEADALRSALVSGVAASGSEIWDFGGGIRTQFDFCMDETRCDFGVYLTAEEKACLSFVQDGCLPMSRAFERKLEGYINRGEYKRAGKGHFGKVVSFSGMDRLYEAHLLRCGTRLDGISVRLKTPLSKTGRVLERVLRRLGCGLDGGPYLGISQDGARLSIFEEGVGFVPHNRLIALMCAVRFERGEDVSLPNSLLAAIDRLAERYHHRAYHYASCPCDSSDAVARELAHTQPFARDGILLAVELLSYLKVSGQSLQQALARVPRFSTVSKQVEIRENPAEVFRKIGAASSGIGEGVRLKDRRGDLLIRPAKSGKSVFIYAESRDTETAAELCDFYADMIKKGPVS